MEGIEGRDAFILLNSPFSPFHRYHGLLPLFPTTPSCPPSFVPSFLLASPQLPIPTILHFRTNRQNIALLTLISAHNILYQTSTIKQTKSLNGLTYEFSILKGHVFHVFFITSSLSCCALSSSLCSGIYISLLRL